jgi:glycosyltransferase involved in cell wall biosynthesis
MRIAFAYQHRRIVGGIETHLNLVMPALLERGHEVAFLHEAEGALERPPIAPDATLTRWSMADRGKVPALAGLKNWRPDLIYNHGVHDLDLEARLLRIAPTVFFAHGYHGTCISGAKSFKNPRIQPCDRQFGVTCLGAYFPRRCGGLSPVTMFREYALQSRRQALLRQCQAVLVASAHMAREYARHGCASIVTVVPLPVPAPPAPIGPRSAPDGNPWHLLFLGRMEPLKGGDLLLEALPLVSRALDKPLTLTLIGDGLERPQLECRSIRLMASHPEIAIHFSGWLNAEARDTRLASCDLLVVPSAWPEPFGLAGVEAGHYGVPSAAFDVGGISDWLKEDINGHLAPGHPPTPQGLANAIVKCLKDPGHHARIRQGATEMARRYRLTDHLTAIEGVFEKVLRSQNVLP